MELRKKDSIRDKRSRKKGRAKKIILRGLAVLGTILLLLVITVFSVVALIAHGPSETFRDSLVQSAMQASATKWVPGLFLSDEVVEDILERASTVNQETVGMTDYKNNYVDGNLSGGGMGEAGGTGESDEWADAKGGMKLYTQVYPNFKAYILLVRDPSRLYVGTSSNFANTAVPGKDIFDIVAQESCVAAINGGEFQDTGGVGNGGEPKGVTYSQGKLVFNQATAKTFIGLDRDNKLVVREQITAAEAEALGIRDGVCFQTGTTENVLITNDGSEVTIHRLDGDGARSQRTAIGQRADGTIILLVTDGRTTSNPGATYNDVTEIMVKFGAVTAGMLDGGSSAMMYYEKYYDVYPEQYDYEKLDANQKKGLVNVYKAFTPPRKIPTFFCVAPER